MRAADLMAVAPEIVLLVAACAILLVEAFFRPQGAVKSEQPGRSGWTPSLAIAFFGLLASAVISVWMLSGGESAFKGTLAANQWAVFFDVLFAVGAAITVLMSPAYLQAHGRHLGEGRQRVRGIRARTEVGVAGHHVGPVGACEPESHALARTLDKLRVEAGPISFPRFYAVVIEQIRI